jgi:hypothetical protein
VVTARLPAPRVGVRQSPLDEKVNA